MLPPLFRFFWCDCGLLDSFSLLVLALSLYFPFRSIKTSKSRQLGARSEKQLTGIAFLCSVSFSTSLNCFNCFFVGANYCQLLFFLSSPPLVQRLEEWYMAKKMQWNSHMTYPWLSWSAINHLLAWVTLNPSFVLLNVIGDTHTSTIYKGKGWPHRGWPHSSIATSISTDTIDPSPTPSLPPIDQEESTQKLNLHWSIPGTRHFRCSLVCA